MKIKMQVRYGRRVAYILSAIFYILNASAEAAPFASWIDVKVDCGAVGDGKADDTVPIQKGLDLIRPEDSKRRILYFPAGMYRITTTVKAIRERQEECQGIGIQGEGPDQSKIVYDGEGHEPMLQWGAWYSTIRGLGFRTVDVGDRRSQIGDGGSVAGNGSQAAGDTPSTISQLPSSAKPAKPTTGIWFGPGFSTANEVSDCAFRDLPVAIQGGTDKTKGQAEVAVERCVFERCGYGLLLANWNSLDWWFWDCLFTNCETGVSNRPGCGEFRIYRSQFAGSKNTDIEVGNLGTFSLVENRSKGSRLFLSVSWGMSAGGNFTLQGNQVEGVTYKGKIGTNEVTGMSIYMGNPGPVLMLDNQFSRSGGTTGPDIYFQSANRGNSIGSALLMGNTTTGTNLYHAEKGYDVRTLGDGRSELGDKGAGVAESGRREVERQGKAENESREAETRPSAISDLRSAGPGVIEVDAGSGGEEIQKAINGAKDGQVIHLPAGTYRLEEPLVIPEGKKTKIVGDGLLNSTCLVPDADFGLKGLIEAEPGANLELRDLALQGPIQGGGALGMLVRVRDQDVVVLKGNQVQTTGFGPGMVVEGLDSGRVSLRNHGHNGITVFGGMRAMKGEKVPGRVEILQGASSRDGNLKPGTPIYDVRQGGRILVRDIWYEGHPPEFLNIQDRGDFVYCGGSVAPNKGQGHSAVNAIQINGKAGSVLMAQAALNGADLTIGKLAEGFFVTLFGLTPYPETRISCGDLGFGRSEMEDGRSEGEKLKTASNAISNIPDPISAKPAEAGFVQLMCRQNNTKITGSESLPDMNADGDIAGRFQALRRWKLPEPNLDAPIKLHRVSCTGSIGLVVVSSQPGAKGKE